MPPSVDPELHFNRILHHLEIGQEPGRKPSLLRFGELGVDDSIRPGYGAIVYVVTIDTPAPEADVQRVLDMARRRVRRLAVADVVGAAIPDGLADRIHRATDGNPFFVAQLARAFRELGRLELSETAAEAVVEEAIEEALVDEAIVEEARRVVSSALGFLSTMPRSCS